MPVSARPGATGTGIDGAQFGAVGARLHAEQHVQRVHRRIESGFEDRDLRLDLRERTLGLVHLEFGRDPLSVQELDQGEQLLARLGLLLRDPDARLQAADRDVDIRRVRGDGEPCRDRAGFGRRVLRAGGFAPAPQAAEHVDFPARSEVDFVGAARAVEVGRGGEHLSQWRLERLVDFRTVRAHVARWKQRRAGQAQ